VLKLALRNLMRNWVRSSLTACSLALAMFLLCILQSVIDGTSSKIADTRSDRLFVASAVSLYVDLPLSYRSKIEQVEGVKEVTRWQWFGGYYQDPSNFFAQFAVDEEPMLSMYPEVDIVEGSREAFLGNRIGCLVGKTLCDRFGWELGERIPLIGALHPHPDGPDTPWEFEIEAIYVPEVTNFDPANLFFHWDYFEKTYELLAGGSLGVGVFAVQLEPGAERAQVIRTVEEMFENGPQRVQATTESEFQSQFVSMYGNVPRFLTFIGGGVLLSILLACLNTMLMAANEQVRDVGILKARGFSSTHITTMLAVQAGVICLVGGGAGLALAKLVENGFALTMASFFPGLKISPGVLMLGGGATLVIAVIAGFLPAWSSNRLSTSGALARR